MYHVVPAPPGVTSRGIVSEYIFCVFVCGFLSIFTGLFSLFRQVRLLVEEKNRLNSEVANLTSQSSFFHKQIPSMRHTIESLSAMREISRVINIHFEFEKILEEVLAIISQLTGATRIDIFLAGISETDSAYPLKAHFSSRGAHGYYYVYFDNDPESMDLHELEFGDFRDYRGDYFSVVDTVFMDKGLYAGNAKIFTRSPGFDIDNQKLFLTKRTTSLEINKENIEKAIAVKNIIRVSGPTLEFSAHLIAEQSVIGVLNMQLDLLKPGDDPDSIENMLRELCKHISLAIKKSELYEKAVKDGMTNLYNKSHFMNQLSIAISEAQNNNEKYSLLLMDIDHFKNVNDTYGHLTGDIILIGVANILRRNLRENDMAFRYGGEELAILLGNTGIKMAGKIGNRIRKAVKEKTFIGEHKEDINITISIGATQFYPDVMNPDPESFISRADQALYRAKEGGRDKVVSARKPKGKTVEQGSA